MTAGHLLGQLQRGLSHHVEETELQGRFERAPETVDDGGGRLIARGDGRKVTPDRIEERRGLDHVSAPGPAR